jgi:hypothetical protein
LRALHQISSMKAKLTLILLTFYAILGTVGLLKCLTQPETAVTPQFYARQFLEDRVKAVAAKHSDGDVIVVSKRDHLLYFCRKGLIVREDRWGGFVFSFPVPVSLGVNNRWTPEGQFSVYTKNPNSRYTLFLGFKGLYGIHGAETRLASRLNMMEAFYPDYRFVTRKDQTLGCVAVENRVIRYLYAQVDVNTPVLIMP